MIHVVYESWNAGGFFSRLRLYSAPLESMRYEVRSASLNLFCPPRRALENFTCIAGATCRERPVWPLSTRISRGGRSSRISRPPLQRACFINLACNCTRWLPFRGREEFVPTFHAVQIGIVPFVAHRGPNTNPVSLSESMMHLAVPF